MFLLSRFYGQIAQVWTRGALRLIRVSEAKQRRASRRRIARAEMVEDRVLLTGPIGIDFSSSGSIRPLGRSSVRGPMSLW